MSQEVLYNTRSKTFYVFILADHSFLSLDMDALDTRTSENWEK
jgi:hypothetical protein